MGSILKDKATAILDSGVGGISVLASARRLLPDENFLFYADNANSPYGDKSTEEVRSLMLENCIELMTFTPLKAIVIACNTATSAAAASLRQILPIPVLGVEPAIKPASEYGKGPVLVIATSLTIREEKFQKLLTSLSSTTEFIPKPCPGLMELIEDDPESRATEDYLRKVISECPQRPQSIVLGCTHYVFLKPMLQRICPDIALFDGNEGVSRHLKNTLEEKGLSGGSGMIRWYSSSRSAAYLDKCRSLFDFAQRKGL